MEFSRRFTVEEAWGTELVASMPEYKGKSLYEVLFENGQVNQFEYKDGMIQDDDENKYQNDESSHFWLLCSERSV